ncbi:MAG: hypothetical protein AAGA34_03620 [Pseudomonadota bacterium]
MFKTVFGIIQIAYALFLYVSLIHRAGLSEPTNLYGIWTVVWIVLAFILFGRGLYNALWLLPTDKEFHYAYTEVTVTNGVGSARNVFQSQHGRLNGLVAGLTTLGAVYYAFVSIDDGRAYDDALANPLFQLLDVFSQLWTGLLSQLLTSLFS